MVRWAIVSAICLSSFMAIAPRSAEAADLWRHLGIGFSAGYHSTSAELESCPHGGCEPGDTARFERLARWKALHDWKCRCHHTARPMCAKGCETPCCDPTVCTTPDCANYSMPTPPAYEPYSHDEAGAMWQHAPAPVDAAYDYSSYYVSPMETVAPMQHGSADDLPLPVGQQPTLAAE